MKNKKLVILCVILDLGAIFCLLLAYGPIDKFKNWFIPTSMGSWTHSYFAKTLYSDKTIQEVLDNNEILEVEGVTDPGQISFNNEDPLVYESIYDEQVLKREEGNDVYKIINIDTETSKGYILVVYDASRISLETSPKIKNGGQQIRNLASTYDALAAVNASGFGRNKSTGALYMVDTLIMKGKLLYSKKGALIGFNNDNILTLTYDDPAKAIENGMKDAVSFGPFLIVNGKASTFKGNGGGGLRPRTAVGQRKDGIVLFVVIDGNSSGTTGMDFKELTNIFVKYGAWNAANLDGGGSSSLWAGGKLINKPGGWGYSGERYLPNAWIIK